MRIAIGADHAGFALKQHLIGTLGRLGHDVDLGTHNEEPVDYPLICAEVGRLVAEAERAWWGQRPGRTDGCQQNPGRPSGALQ